MQALFQISFILFRLWVSPWILFRKIEAHCHIAFSPKEQGDQDPLETKVASGLRLGAKPLMLPFEGKRLSVLYWCREGERAESECALDSDSGQVGQEDVNRPDTFLPLLHKCSPHHPFYFNTRAQWIG